LERVVSGAFGDTRPRERDQWLTLITAPLYQVESSREVEAK